MIIISRYLIPKGYLALTLFPLILVKVKGLVYNKVLVNHERIHLRQQLELLVVPFYVVYGLEFLVRFIIFQNRNKAYRAISFEREAYSNEANLQFLEKRPFWNFMRYF